VVNPSRLAADGTFPHDIAGRGIKGSFNDAGAPPAAGTPPARYRGKPGFGPRRRGGGGDEAGQLLGEPPGGAGRRGDCPLRRQKMGEVGDPGLGHDRYHLHLVGRASSLLTLPLPAARHFAHEPLKLCQAHPPLRFFVQIRLGDGQTAPLPELVEKIDAVLAHVKDGWRTTG
jgi:hypothetical protein